MNTQDVPLYPDCIRQRPLTSTIICSDGVSRTLAEAIEARVCGIAHWFCWCAEHHRLEHSFAVCPADNGNTGYGISQGDYFTYMARWNVFDHIKGQWELPTLKPKEAE